MRRTNEEFRAEVFRRKDEYLKARNKRIVKSIVTTLVCLPLFCVVTFMSLMLGIAMSPAGSAGPPDKANMEAIVRAEVRGEEELRGRALSEKASAELAALLEEITVYGEVFEHRDQDDATEKYEVVLYDEKGGRAYFHIAEFYVSKSGERFALSRGQYEQFLEIISEGETQ